MSHFTTVTVAEELLQIYRKTVQSVAPNRLLRDAIRIDLDTGVISILDTRQQQTTRSKISNNSSNYNKPQPNLARQCNLLQSFSTSNRPIYIFGAGKAVFSMAHEFVQQIDRFNQSTVERNRPSSCGKINLVGGVLSVPHGTSTKNALSDDNDGELFDRYNIRCFAGAHNNQPDKDSMIATQAILNLIDSAYGSIQKSVSDDLRNITSNKNKLMKPNAYRDQQPPPQKCTFPPPSLPLFIGFISGGGSALLTAPSPENALSLEEKLDIIQQMVHAGADIVELNTVRSALSAVKRGKLAQRIIERHQQWQASSALAPTTTTTASITAETPQQPALVTFIISDIIGDPLHMIASGPTVNSNIQCEIKPIEIIRKYRLNVSEKIMHALLYASSNSDTETKLIHRESQDYSLLVRNFLIGSNAIALDTASSTATNDYHYQVIQTSHTVSGEVQDVVKCMAQSIIDYIEDIEQHAQQQNGVCWLSGGECTITMKKKNDDHDEDKEEKMIGVGGRCQEMALLMYREIQHRIVQSSKTSKTIATHLNDGDELWFLAAGTDGQDGPTPVAGVIIRCWPPPQHQPSSLSFFTEFDHEIDCALARHDSYTFLRRYANYLPQIIQLIETGPSGTNVMDVYALIWRRGHLT